MQKVKNPFEDKATRVDYYQLVRKWRVDLHRYGIRLTYGLTIPEPGSEILTKIKEIETIHAALEQGFGSPEATLPWARFDLKPWDITPQNYLGYVAQYKAPVEMYPAPSKPIHVADIKEWTQQQASQVRNGILMLDVGEDYYVQDVWVDYTFWPWDENWNRNHPEWYADVLYDTPDSKGIPHFLEVRKAAFGPQGLESAAVLYRSPPDRSADIGSME